MERTEKERYPGDNMDRGTNFNGSRDQGPWEYQWI